MPNITIKVGGVVVYDGPSGDVDVKVQKQKSSFFGSFSSVTIHGDLTGNGQTISSSGVPPLVIQGNVTGNVRADGSVQANNIGGDVQAGGSCQCDDVGGSVNAGGSIQCDNIKGHANAGGSIVADRIGC
jgi:hypothetical protein